MSQLKIKNPGAEAPGLNFEEVEFFKEDISWLRRFVNFQSYRGKFGLHVPNCALKIH